MKKSTWRSDDPWYVFEIFCSKKDTCLYKSGNSCFCFPYLNEIRNIECPYANKVIVKPSDRI